MLFCIILLSFSFSSDGNLNEGRELKFILGKKDDVDDKGRAFSEVEITLELEPDEAERSDEKVSVRFLFCSVSSFLSTLSFFCFIESSSSLLLS
jgi:hypothetical protein